MLENIRHGLSQREEAAPLPVGSSHYNRVNFPIGRLLYDRRTGLTGLHQLGLAPALEGLRQLLHVPQDLLALRGGRANLNVDGQASFDLYDV